MGVTEYNDVSLPLTEDVYTPGYGYVCYNIRIMRLYVFAILNCGFLFVIIDS